MTSKTRHTAGPWEVHPLGRRIRSAEVDTPTEFRARRDVAQVAGDLDEDKANAHLIAAAPELLEALKEAVDWMRRNAPSDGWGLLDVTQDTYRDRALEAAAAAIAKAKGEANG